ncbi:MAG: UTP--glucose-1-phosphate uridylyltransferase [Chlamydiales bacterium]|nr:UTP--glucose-1-phosphate uridylyltransferase [Chlamydiales bacterium]
MLKDLILEYLTALGQKQLYMGVEGLSPSQQERFLAQLKKYDAHLLKRQREALFRKPTIPAQVEPLKAFDQSGSKEDQERGRELLAKGKVGCLILAGGHGSRLGSNLPKGVVPLTPVSKKGLLQLFLEKAAAAAKQGGAPLPVAIMTSPLNHNETLSFLERNKRFGLREEHCSFFLQSTLPYLDDAGNWVLEAPGLLAEGADGNGGTLSNFFNSGIWAKWKQIGIEYVNVIPVDNPLCDPFDAEGVGYLMRTKCEALIKGILRRNKEEKVGVIGSVKDHLKVVEYTELPENEKAAVTADGSLLWKIANAGLFCFTMDFIESLARNPHFFLPWHMANKSTRVMVENSTGGHQETVKVWKCESFIFDVLNFTTRARSLVYPREEIFAPLKNATGSDSFETVQRALLEKDRHIIKQITGREPPSRLFELDQAFYYPTPDLLQKWKGRELPQDQEYILP